MTDYGYLHGPCRRWDEIQPDEYFTECLRFRAWLDKWGHEYLRVYHGVQNGRAIYRGIVCSNRLKDKGLKALADPSSEKDPARVKAAQKAAETRKQRKAIADQALELFPGCTCGEFSGPWSDERKAVVHADRCRYWKALNHLWRCLELEIQTE